MKSVVRGIRGILVMFCLLMLTDAVLAQYDLTSDGIVQALKPKVKTRGAPSGLSPSDAAFVDRLKQKTRGITVEERAELATVVQQSGAPAIDLEVNFAYNSAAITPAAAVTLSKLGQALRSKELGGATFLLSGHTDARGSKDYNQKLSEERAKAVRSFLIDNFSIEPTRMLAVGYGFEQLKNPANPEADENRRVQVVNLMR